MGASSGITTVAGVLKTLAACATPCAWLPEEYAITPRLRSSSLNLEIADKAPLTLKDPVI